MNYFRCTVGGSGNGNTVTVTCAEEFAGLTITLAKTGKTYTKTCPSTAPYTVTFNGVENGTYTVSTTYEGETYSTEVIVQDVSCVLNYGFKWQTWVDTAQFLDSSDYSTLDDVLEDKLAVRELFLEHACVDFMASVGASNEDLETVINNDLCAKWINNSDYALDYLYANEVIADLMDEADKYFYGEWGLVGQVPAMISNTIPHGTASASSEYNTSYAAWKAFDGNDDASNYWYATRGEENSYIQYSFAESTCIKKVYIHARPDSSRTDVATPTAVKLQGSNDGTNFTTLKEWDLSSFSFYNFMVDDTVENENAYQTYRCQFVNTSQGGKGISVAEIQFYAWGPKGNVPQMTSNTAPFGEAVKNGEQSNHPAWWAFNDAKSDTWASTSAASGHYLGYHFTNPVNVRKVLIRVNLDPEQTVRVEYSDDGSTWIPTTSVITYSSASGQIFTLDVNDYGYHLYWRVYHVSSPSALYFQLYKLQFYGRELKVSVPKMTSNTVPFGEAFGNTESNGANAYMAFDKNYTNCAISNANPSVFYVGYDFGNKVKLSKVYLSNRNNSDARAIHNYKIQGSDDGVTYNDVVPDIIINPNTQNLTTVIDIEDTYPAYRYFRVYATSGYASYWIIAELQFYGLDYSEKEFEVGTTKKWLYDHGVELDEITLVKGSGAGNQYTKEESQIYLVSGSANGSTANFSALLSDAIDLTSYSLYRMRNGNKIGTNENTGLQVISSLSKYPDGGSYSDSYTVASVNPMQDGNMPNNHAVDVSNVTGTNYLAVDVAYRPNAALTITELWLE